MTRQRRLWLQSDREALENLMGLGRSPKDAIQLICDEKKFTRMLYSHKGLVCFNCCCAVSPQICDRCGDTFFEGAV